MQSIYSRRHISAVGTALGSEQLEHCFRSVRRKANSTTAQPEMIQEIISLAIDAKDCLMPCVDSFMLPDDLTNEEAIARLK